MPWGWWGGDGGGDRAASGSSAAEITLRNGVVRAALLTTSGPQLTNSAVLAAIGGTKGWHALERPVLLPNALIERRQATRGRVSLKLRAVEGLP